MQEFDEHLGSQRLLLEPAPPMRITTIPSGVGIVIDPYDRTGKLGPANTITDDDTLYCNSI